MSESDPSHAEPAAADTGRPGSSLLGRSLKIAILLVALLLGAVAVTAFLAGEDDDLAFDYEGLLRDTGYDLETVREIQRRTAVGDTPLVELHNLTALVRSISPPGRGARIFVKDEAANPSGSFKDRRASISAHEAHRRDSKAAWVGQPLVTANSRYIHVSETIEPPTGLEPCLAPR